MLLLFAQGLYFVGGEHAPCAGRQVAEVQGSLAHADEPPYLAANFSCDQAYLAFAAFVHDDAYPRAFGGIGAYVYPRWGRAFAFQQHAFAPTAQGFGVGGRFYEAVVFFFNLETGVGEAVGQGSVVGEQDESFAVGVEPSDGKDSFGDVYQVYDGFASLRVVGGGDDANGFVEHEVDQAGGSVDGFAVNLNIVAGHIYAGA